MRYVLGLYPTLQHCTYFAFGAQVWEEQFSSAGLGGFFKPCAYLESHAASGQALSAGVSAASRL